VTVIRAHADDLANRFTGLQAKADAKDANLQHKLAQEKAKEAARQAWANVAKDYVQWAGHAAQKVSAR
jgi:hypothetical protein